MATKRSPPPLTSQDSFLSKRFHGDDEEALVVGVYLNEESLTQITRLFKIIDRNSDGKLDIHDFTLDGQITTNLYKKWQELRDKFDYDGDGQVTIDEFRRGFKKMVLGLGCTVNSPGTKGTTIEGYLLELEKHINAQVQELCKEAFTWYSNTVVL